jgi:hypothetical protein
VESLRHHQPQHHQRRVEAVLAFYAGLALCLVEELGWEQLLEARRNLKKIAIRTREEGERRARAFASSCLKSAYRDDGMIVKCFVMACTLCKIHVPLSVTSVEKLCGIRLRVCATLVPITRTCYQKTLPQGDSGGRQIGHSDDEPVEKIPIVRAVPPRTSTGLRSAVVWKVILPAVLFMALCGCQSRPADTAPAIVLTRIPPAAQGGREKVDTIAGRVKNARPGQQIVIYARSGPWWVQPWPDHALIPIQADSTWRTETHLGYEYAALLVDADYHPLPTLDVAPSQGGPVAVATVVKGTGAPLRAPTKPLKFSDYDWDVRTIASDRGGTNNLYDPANAWTDESGALHLQIDKKTNRWSCAEMVLNRGLGYGTYLMTVREASHLPPAAVLSMTTWDEWGGDQNYREMDIEISRWGDAENRNNAQYLVQPFYIPGNVAGFYAPPGVLTYLMRWESGRASFKTFRGRSADAGAPVLTEHEFTSGIPSPGQAKVHLIFYVVASEKSPLQKPAEVVIEKFEYLP